MNNRALRAFFLIAFGVPWLGATVLVMWRVRAMAGAGRQGVTWMVRMEAASES